MKTWEIIDLVWEGLLARHLDWRPGQALFNAINLVRPDLAETLRATSFDPFFDHKDGPRIQLTVGWLKEQTP